MKILSIETSCDETGAAVLEKDGSEIRVLSNIVASSIMLHRETGGIIPESAAREQIKFILPVITRALLESENQKTKSTFDDFRVANQILKKDIDAIAVTYGPGLVGSLLVGVETAKTLSYALNKPLVPINHLLAHIFANFIGRTSLLNAYEQNPKLSALFPFIGLIVSGGHTDLLYFESIHKFKWLGGTLDDAAGECFDKCARLLGYSYPGGPKISKLAEKGSLNNIILPKLMKGDNLDFSFSGLKTAFMNIVKKEFKTSNKPNERGYSWTHANIDELPKGKKQFLYNLCASLENTIVEVLVRKTLKAAEQYNCKTILLGGGVSANKTLRKELKLSDKRLKLSANVFFPEKKYATDNAAMIGTYALINYKPADWRQINAEPELYFD